MRATTVRFSEDLWELLETEAVTQRISAAQFVRDAAIMRLGILSGRRGDRDASLTLEDLAAGALTGRHNVPEPVVGNVARLSALRATKLLDSGTAKDVSGVVRITSRNSDVEEREVLYAMDAGKIGAVDVWERGGLREGVR